MVSQVKEKIAGSSVTAHADDPVIIAEPEIDALKEIFEEFNLVLNEEKSVSYFEKLGNIPMRRGTTYLGCKVNTKGEPRGITNLAKANKEANKSIGRALGHMKSLRPGGLRRRS